MNWIETVAAMETITTELKPWQEHNFPGRRAIIQLLGSCEEYFEAQEALGDKDQWLDGAADSSIFLIDFCRAIEERASVLYCVAIELVDPSGRPWPRYLGRAVHHYIKWQQGVRGEPEFHRRAMCNAIGCVFVTLEHDVARMGRSYPDVLLNTWNQVKQRDWKLHPETGLPQRRQVNGTEQG